ncbi:MAG TPA: hypothetical protein VMB71_16575 [Acetobacteraceae bacterium]|nr:hypothetical protein [Acetobacteraceae bacterium]
MLLSVLIAVELCVSLGALAVLGAEPADRARIFGDAPANPPAAPIPRPIVGLARRGGALRRVSGRRRSLQRLLHQPSLVTRRGAASWRFPRANPPRPLPPLPEAHIIPLWNSDSGD